MLMMGQILYGFCGGFFGRDSYIDKRVEAVGIDWIVARHIDDGSLVFAKGKNIHEELKEYINPEEG